MTLISIVITRLLEIAVEWPDWTIPWAGIGAFLMGTGSLLTGFAALKNAQRRGEKDEAEKTESTNSVTDKPGPSARGGVSDGDPT